MPAFICPTARSAAQQHAAPFFADEPEPVCTQTNAEQPHCIQREADLFAAMDDMGHYATKHLEELR